MRTEDTLETLIDAVGLSRVVDALSAVCHGKAEHLRVNWQDENAAREWEHDAKHIERALSKLSNY